MEASPRLVFLIVFLIFVFLTPDQTPVQRLSKADNELLNDLREADFDVIANSTYGELETSGLNLTGLRSEDEHQWQLLPEVKDLVRQRQETDRADAVVYRRLTADIRGSFKRLDFVTDQNKAINLTALDPSGAYIASDFQRNVTDRSGEISISLEDSTTSEKARELKANLAIYSDHAPGNGWEATLEGVHFPSGSIILSTASRKFNGLPALPHLALNENDFNASKSTVLSKVADYWEQAFKGDHSLLTVPSCELVVWLSQKSLSESADYIKLVESELETPEGAPIGVPHPIAFSAVIFSPDCGYVLEADPIFGPKAEAYWALVQRLLVAFIVIIALEITLLKRQMEKCATPSTRARISFYSIGIAAFGDGLTLFATIGLLMLESGAFLLLSAAAFLCCMHVAFFEVKFIFDIWTVQVGEPAQAQRERQRRTAAASTTTGPEGLPLPATARTNAATPATGAQNNLAIETPRANFGSLYSRFYFALINLMFFSLWALSWPQTIRAIYVNSLAACYFSLWVPQIYRNIMRNCRKALNWEYVIGTSVLRAVPVLYWYLDDNNVLAAKTNSTSALLLTSWLWLQVMVLLSQQFLGPRVFVKESWCPPAYDYHPILYDDLESGGMPIGELASASEGKDKDNKTRKVFDCAICMNEIDVPVISKDENKGRSWLEQRNYMVTPCRHIFHTDCLEGWMNLRLVCPVCRETLPPL